MTSSSGPALTPVDLPGEGPLVLVMDVDSTLIRDEVIELIAEHAGTRDEVAAVTEAAMRGELDFAGSLHARVATLEGLSVEVLDRVRAAVRLTPGARTLVSSLVEAGHVVGLVSGGFTEIVDDLARDLGIPTARANHLEIVDGRLTGKVLGEVVDRAAKADFITLHTPLTEQTRNILSPDNSLDRGYVSNYALTQLRDQIGAGAMWKAIVTIGVIANLGILGFFNSLIDTGSTAAQGFVSTGSTAAKGVYGTVTGSLGDIVGSL